MKRIAIGGWQHETNTFAPFDTDYAAFEMADGWPALAEGHDIIDAVAGINMPIEGFIQAARGAAELVPALWTSAEPGGYVTDDAFERIAGRLCERIAAAGPLDGVYLDLHGAMVTRRFGDAEGELLARIRRLIGPDTPLVASLDLHANITRRMVQEASALTVYRTYPHVDMAETGARAAELMLRMPERGRLFKAYRQGEYLVPLYLGGTDFEPNRTLYSMLGASASRCLSADIALGFPPSDMADAGPGIVVYGNSADEARHLADGLHAQLAGAESRYAPALLDPDTAIARAMANDSGRPVVLADTQDNSGAGGASDGIAPVRDLIRHGARQAVVAMVTDPEFAARAHACGVGRSFEGALGGKLGRVVAGGADGSETLRGSFRVLALGDGKLTCTGPVCLGARMSLGAMALVAVENSNGADVRVVVSSVRSQPLDQAMLRHVGVEPAAERILVLKSSVHFRADFSPLAAEVLVVEWPGCNPAEALHCDYRNLRPDVRLAPLGPYARRGMPSAG